VTSQKHQERKESNSTFRVFQREQNTSKAGETENGVRSSGKEGGSPKKRGSTAKKDHYMKGAETKENQLATKKSKKRRNGVTRGESQVSLSK